MKNDDPIKQAELKIKNYYFKSGHRVLQLEQSRFNDHFPVFGDGVHISPNLVIEDLLARRETLVFILGYWSSKAKQRAINLCKQRAELNGVFVEVVSIDEVLNTTAFSAR